MSGQTILPDEAEPQHITNCVPFVIDGSRTQTSDVPFVFHVSISKGIPAPVMSTNAMSSPVNFD